MTYRAIVALILGATLLILTTLGISTARNVSRGDALAGMAAEEVVARAADVAQSVLDRHLLQVDGQLVAVAAWLRHGLISRQDPPQSSEVLLELAARSYTHGDLMLADARGIIWASGDPERIGEALPLPAEVLARAVRDAVSSLNGPMPSRQDGLPVLLMLRRIAADEAGAPVFAVAEIPTEMITNVLAPMTNPPQLRVRLETLGGRILAAGPGQVHLTGQTVRPAPDELPPGLQVRLRGDRQMTGQVFSAARPLAMTGLLAVVALPEAVALGGWPLLRLSILTGLAIAALLLTALAAAVFFATWNRQRAAIEREAANLRLLAAVESLPDAFVLWDAEERLVIWNSRYAELYSPMRETLRPGLRFEDAARGWIAADIFKPVPNEAQCSLARMLASHRNLVPAVEEEMHDGRWLRVARSRMPRGGTVVILTDITALKHAVAELGEARDAADRATAVKANLLAHVSHELRTPLAGLLRLAEALKRDANLAPAQRHQAGLVGATARHLLALANEVLDLAAMEAQSLTLQLGIASPQEICNEAMAMVQPLAEAKQVGLAFTHSDLPAQIEVDATRLRQMLLNLLANAVKFTPQGTQVRLSATVQGTPERLRCEVCDQGGGVPEAQRGELFRDFTRLASGRAPDGTSQEGTGLGLSITARLASLMAGQIGCTDATPPPGACFWVELPFRRITAQEVPPSSGSILAQRHLRLLAVDDAPSNLAVLRALLSNTDFDLETVSEGRAALEAVEIAAREGRPFDAVLMDVMMPGMDGLETTRRLRAMPGMMGRMPVIAVTASAFPEDIAKTRAAGMQDHVIKPVDRSLLLNTLAACVSAPGSSPDGPDPTLALRPMFLAELKLRLDQLDQPVRSGTSAIEAVHALAGTVGHLGQPEHVIKARRVLAALRAGAPEAEGLLQTLLAELRAAFPELASAQT